MSGDNADGCCLVVVIMLPVLTGRGCLWEELKAPQLTQRTFSANLRMRRRFMIRCQKRRSAAGMLCGTQGKVRMSGQCEFSTEFRRASGEKTG